MRFIQKLALLYNLVSVAAGMVKPKKDVKSAFKIENN